MSCVKLPPWTERLASRCRILKKEATDQEGSFWKEQCLRFGYDVRTHDIPPHHGNRWLTFLLEKSFEYSLKSAYGELRLLSQEERRFWKRYGAPISHLELGPSCHLEDLYTLSDWFPHLTSLTLAGYRPETGAHHAHPAVSCFSHLTFLELRDCAAVDTLLELAPHTLRHLIIKECHLAPEGDAPLFSRLTHLESLHILFSPTLLQNQFGRLPPRLAELDLSGSGKHISQEELIALPQSLTVLKLNRWHHCGDSEIALLPKKLKVLEIESWRLSGTGIRQLGEYGDLVALDIANSSHGEFDYGIEKLPRRLHTLNLSRNRLEGSAVHQLQGFCGLRVLRIDDATAYHSDFSKHTIAFPRGLHTLSLAHSGPFSPKTIQRLQELIQLRTLSLCGCDLASEQLEGIPENIVSLDLADNGQLADTALSSLATLPHLRTLTLDGCEEIRGIAIDLLPATLEELSINACHRFSGKSLINLPRGLKALSCASCDLISASDLANLPAGLEVLNLAFCRGVTDAAIAVLARLPYLHTVTLQGCQGITEEGVSELKSRGFTGTVVIKSGYGSDYRARSEKEDVECHPPLKFLKKLVGLRTRAPEYSIIANNR